MNINSSYTQEMVSMRRSIHQKPETGWTEFRTTALVVRRLKELGFEVKMGKAIVNTDFVMGRYDSEVKLGMQRALQAGITQEEIDATEGYTGAVGIWKTGKPGPVTAIRYDLDALYVPETTNPEHIPNKKGFASQYPGVMHACGHDCHTAIGLSVAHWIADHKDELCGTIKLIFQPAEEGVRGGAAQAVSGKLEDVDYILGCHLAMMCPTGEVCTTPTGVLCTTKLDIRFTGAPAHPTMSPHLGRNALAAACNCAGQLLGMARHGKGLGCVNVGLMKAGECRNVIPVHAELQIEVRGETAEINDYMVDQAIRIVKGTSIAYDVQYEVEKVGEAGELINDDELVNVVAQCAKEEPTCQQVVPFKKIGCSEDYTMLAKEVRRHGGKSCFFVVGADRTAAHHQAEFDFDEKGMLTAFGIFTKALLKLNSNV